MRHRINFRLLRLAALGAMLTAALAAQEEGNRFALVIGNDAYIANPLQNAVNDARLLDKALKDAGFKTTLVEDVNLASLESSVSEFLAKPGPADTALFFYAGHGVQIENENFLVPVDFGAAGSASAAKQKLFSMAQLFAGLKKGPRRSIVILDACRSNPMAQQNSLPAGLAQPQNPPDESYVVFSTGPGQTAADNSSGRNSYFSEALAMEIARPDTTIEEVVNHVRATVSNETHGEQTPWALSSLKATFYFHPLVKTSADRTISMNTKWMAEARRFEQWGEWQEALERVARIIQSKSGGSLQAAAEGRKAYLAARQDAEAAYDRGDYAAAAQAFEAAFRLDPFAIEAAFQGVSSYLQQDQIPQAVRLLHLIRAQGSSDAGAKAVKMLDELKTVDGAAAEEAVAAETAPPPAGQLFPGVHAGLPDWDAGARLLANSPVDASGVLQELGAKLSPPAAPQPPTDAMSAIGELLKGVFHVEVAANLETRDLTLKRAAAGTLDDNTGFLEIDGRDALVPVLFQGKILHLPAGLAVPAGKYEIRSLESGKVVDSQSVEVTPGALQMVTIKR
jgi:tetratricopeptide (TPR) repeat protein